MIHSRVVSSYLTGCKFFDSKNTTIPEILPVHCQNTIMIQFQPFREMPILIETKK